MKRPVIYTKQRKTGFTIIEISLFLGISAAIFVAVALSISGGISRQRYNDTVQDFAQFLRDQYFAVTAVQSSGTGQSDKAIYGRLITFGESGKTIYAYDIMGDALSSDSFSGLSVLDALTKADAFIPVQTDAGGQKSIPNQTSYDLAWDGEAQSTKQGTLFKGSIIIVRSPTSGIVYTYYTDAPLSVQHQKAYNTSGKIGLFKNVTYKKVGTKVTSSSAVMNYSTYALDFCVYSEDIYTAKRRNIRLEENGHNATAVQLIDQDSEENAC